MSKELTVSILRFMELERGEVRALKDELFSLLPSHAYESNNSWL
jgi:hypothetical protein